MNKPCFTDGFKCPYIKNITANLEIVTNFWSNQFITQMKNNSYANFPKFCIRIDIHFMFHIKVNKSRGQI